MSTLSHTISNPTQSIVLFVTRNQDKGRLTLSIAQQVGRRRVIAASIGLDLAGWHDLLQCVALPPPLPEMLPPTEGAGKGRP